MKVKITSGGVFHNSTKDNHEPLKVGAIVEMSEKQGQRLINLGNAAMVEEAAKEIAENTPRLEDLHPEQLKQLMKLVMAQNLANDLKAKAQGMTIDLQKEKGAFIAACKSSHTQGAYRNALERLFTFAGTSGINLAGLTPAQADNFIYEMASNESPSVVRLTASVASAFYTFLERRHETIRNPFRGTKARPKEKKIRAFAYPSQAEVEAIIEKIPKPYGTAIAIMAQTGLRVGALPTLKKIGNRFSVESKGKGYAVDLPEDLAKEMETEPYKGKTVRGLGRRLEYYIEKLYNAGTIKEKYSPHDFRHYFAIKFYERTKDIYQTRQALHHSNIAVTERYLRGLGQV